MFSSNSRKRRSFRKALVGAVTAAVLVPTAASARPDGASYDPVAQQPEIPYLSWGVGITRPAPEQGQGGVTPTNLARAYVAPERGVSQPDGYQPQLRGDQPIVVRDAPDGYQPQTRTVEAKSASGRGIDMPELFGGFILGVALAITAALALSAVRGGPRAAES